MERPGRLRIRHAAPERSEIPWKTERLERYLQSGGAEGHIVDVSDIGGHKLNTTLLLRYTGRKSG